MVPAQATWARPASGPQPAAVRQERPDEDGQVFLPLLLKQQISQVTTISPEQGGKIGLPGGEVSLSVPAGAVTGTVRLEIQSANVTNPSGASRLGPVVEVTAADSAGQPVSQLLKPATLEFRYDAGDLAYFAASSLSLRSKSGASGWEYLSTQLDSARSVATASTTHFSSFGLFGPSIVSSKSYGLAADSIGNLYYLAEYSGASGTRLGLWQRSAGGSQAKTLCPLDWLPSYANEWVDLELESGSGVFYISIQRQVYRLTPKCELTEIMSMPDYASEIHGLHYSAYYKALFVAHSNAIIQIDPASGAEIRRVGDGWIGTWSDVVTDGRGWVFGLLVTQTNLHPEFSHLVWWEDPDQPGVHTEQGGFIGGRRMAIDTQDAIYLSNYAGNAISIVEPGEVTVRSYAPVYQPGALVVRASQILAASGGYVAAVPAGLPAPGGGSASLSPTNTLSGFSGAMQVTTNQAGVIPAHYTLRLGSEILRAVANYDPSSGAFGYAVPYTILQYASPWPYKAPSPGLYNLSFCGRSLLAGVMQTPGTTGAQSANTQDGNVQYLARGEWLYWASSLSKIESLESLFPVFENKNRGLILVYQFNHPGEYHFRVEDYLGAISNQTVIVSAEGQPSEPGYGRLLEYDIDPHQGLRIWYSGTHIEVPDKALPGEDPYKLKLTIWNVANPSQDAPTASSFRYELQWYPEPAQLNKPISMALPYDPSKAGGTPLGVFLDPEVQDLVDLHANVTGNEVRFSFPAGTYGAGGPGLAEVQGVQATDVSWGSLNKIGKSLWWVVGLPNEQVFDDHFTVLYNTEDASEAYAQKLLEALQTARAAFEGTYTMPSNRVIVKIAPWIAPGTRPGATTSLLFNYHLFFNNALSDDELEATAAHEFFHVLQRKNTTLEGYLLAPTWFLEGTATWAEYKVFPQNTTYLRSIGGYLDFPRYGFDQWGSMAIENQYATMAFFEYLEQEKGDGSIKEILDGLSSGQVFRVAMDLLIGDWASFYPDFAADFWMREFEPVSGWNLDASFTKIELTSAVNVLVSAQTPALSSGVIQAYWNNVKLPNPPDSFQQASGSVVRATQICEQTGVLVFDKGKRNLGELSGPADPQQVVSLNKLGDYIGVNGLFFLYANSQATQSCFLTITWETPTVIQLNPGSVAKGASASIRIEGGGFGTEAGEVVTDMGTFTPTGWATGYVTFMMPAQSSPGAISVQVKLPSGELSNPRTLTVEP